MNRQLAILDIETDPFKHGRVPEPFAVGIYTLETFTSFWGNDCIKQSIPWLAEQDGKWVIYAHNGGKFDFMFYLNALAGKMTIINGRLVSAKLGNHEIRDSLAIMPFPLRDYKKDDIDYSKLERNCRETHKSEIISYLRADCVYLHELVSSFHAKFGQAKLTIGSTAMTEIKKLHTIERTTLAFDRVFRPQFYFGGRVQCLGKTGIIHAPVKIYDVNSMYPSVMRNCLHPSGTYYIVGKEITDDTCFIVADGTSNGAFPRREIGTGGINFGNKYGTYSTTRHEWDVAIATGTFLPERIRRTYDFPVRASFANFVDNVFGARRKAQELGNSIDSLLYKFVLNSGYGKFAQNPANFFDFIFAPLINRPGCKCPHCNGYGACDGCFKCQTLNNYKSVDTGICQFCMGSGERWSLAERDNDNPDGPCIWKARTFIQDFYNVATGASITGAARAMLLRGISQADAPLYCDTDSIITEGEFHGDVGKELGQWKYEGQGVLSAIAGKKLYAIFDDAPPILTDEEKRKYPWMLEVTKYKGKNYWCIKKAHKGFKLSPSDILTIASGKTIEVPNAAPTFSLFRQPSFITRTARMTI